MPTPLKNFYFLPYKFAERKHFIEKESSTGQKERYLEGITSGTKQDKDGERMTAKCIKSFIDQASSGEILLYPDAHGIKATEDIGKLDKGQVLEDGDWWTSYKLHNPAEVGPIKAEKINDVWKQSAGLPPYNVPRQKGFSIEGYIPDGGIIDGQVSSDGSIKKRVIDDIRLIGVILTPIPAYASVANAIAKSLGEMSPHVAEKIQKDFQGELSRIVEKQNTSNVYFRKRWEIMDALDHAVERIMNNKAHKAEQLDIVFNEFKQMSIDLIMKSESLFVGKTVEEVPADVNPYKVSISTVPQVDIFKSILSNLEKLSQVIGRYNK